MTGHFLSTSSSFSLTGRSLPPTLSPRILPSLSNEVALHRLEIAHSVNVVLPIAITSVEEWLRGKAPGGSTVELALDDKYGRGIGDGLLACNLSLSDSAS